MSLLDAGAAGAVASVDLLGGQVRDDRQLARGTLDIKGKRRNAEVPFRLRESGGKPLVSGSFTLDRLDYGIGTGEWSDTRWLGAEVKIDFSAALSRR